MNDHFRPSGRTILTDLVVTQNLTGEILKNRQFVRLVATRKRFTYCDFSFSQFDSAYLRNCVFDSCKFIGCRFTQSNLRGSKFEGCVFDYAEFSHSHIEPEILDTGCPGQENLQQKFARSLRMNFHQMGDNVAANKAIKIELYSTKIHLHKAWKSRESYYRKKYPGIKRFSIFIEWLNFVFLDIFWGNGESPLKLISSLIILIFAISLFDIYFIKDEIQLHSYWTSLTNAPQVLLGIDQPSEFPKAILSFVAGLRYIMLVCLVSILIKRFSRR